jgi:hypothetical protein
MRVRCIETTGANLSLEQKKMGYHENVHFPITIGSSYVVYGMTLWAGHIWYLISGDHKQFPEWMPDDLFAVSDSKLSKHWHYKKNQSELANPIQGTWGYKELTSDLHADELTDNDLEALEVFNIYKELMDLEFADPENSVTAKAADYQNWVICAICDEAWEVFSDSGRVRCPNCRSILNNPLHTKTNKLLGSGAK